MGLKENGNGTEVADSVFILSPSVYENHFTKFLQKREVYNTFYIHVMHGYYYLKNISTIFLRLKYSRKQPFTSERPHGATIKID